MAALPSRPAAEIGDRRKPFLFIILTLALDAMGIGLILPVMPDLIRDVTGQDLSSAAVWGGIMTAIFALMQFLCGPTLGSLSDRFGRRPVLLTSLVVVAIDYVIMGLAHAMWLLILTRLIGGIASATQATATAFIADISRPEEKAQNFGIVGAAFGVGFVLGPLFGGFLAEFGHRAPFYAAGALAAMNFVFGYIVLPETVSKEMRRPFLWRRANPVGALLQMRKLPGMVRFLILAFVYEFAFIVYPATWAYFGQEQFGWDARMIGISLGCFGISMAFVQGYLIRIVIPKFGERKVIFYGFGFNFLIFAILAFIENGWLTLAVTPLAAFGAVVTPALQGLMSQRAADNQQGELQGLISSFKSMATILSPLAMTAVFFWATRDGGAIYLPGAPFLISLLLMVVCWGLFVAVDRSEKTTTS